MGKDIWDAIAPIAGAVLGTAILPGIGTELGMGISGLGAGAIGSGVGSAMNTGIKTGDPLAAVESGALSGAGNYLGSSLLGPVFDGASSTLSSTPANALGGIYGGEAVGSAMPLGSFAGNALGSSTMGSILGSTIGGTMAQNVGSDILGTDFSSPAQEAAPGPSQVSIGSLPGGLGGLAGLSSGQQSSNIATQGMYGSGAGTDENKYFTNLINNRLVDASGNVGDMSQLSPIELSYLNKLGISGSNSNELLKGISNYGTS